jgi:hypothetical protein
MSAKSVTDCAVECGDTTAHCDASAEASRRQEDDMEDTKSNVHEGMDIEEEKLDDEWIESKLDVRKDGVLHVLDNIPKQLYELRNLYDYVENSLGIVPCQYLIGKYLDKGGIHVWLHVDIRLNQEVRTLPGGVILKEVMNRKKEASKSVLVFGVPMHFPCNNFKEFDENIKEVIRWNPPKGKTRSTGIVELVYHNGADAKAVLQKRRFVMDGIRYNIEPKFLAKGGFAPIARK